MRQLALIAFLALLLTGCASRPAPVDPVASLLDPGESVRLRVSAELMDGHDMEEPRYDMAEGYQPIPTYSGELLLTDLRLLFVVKPAGPEAAWVSIPYESIARARPSRTPLLHYIVVWDKEGRADSFVVDAGVVQALHRTFGEAMMAKGTLILPPQASPGRRAP